MSEADIAQAFLTTLNPNNEMRKAAETFLESTKGTPGLFEILIKIVNTHENFAVRQGAVVYLKNQCKNWIPRKKQVPIPEQDKELVRSQVFYCIYHNREDKIRSQYEEIIKIIAVSDFPDAWPQII
jgi:hypothetical protein